jgi:hypothetical protein
MRPASKFSLCFELDAHIEYQRSRLGRNRFHATAYASPSVLPVIPLELLLSAM